MKPHFLYARNAESGMNELSRSCRKKRGMKYRNRLKQYEADKQQLWLRALKPDEYEAEIKKLARKWKI